MGGVGSGRKAVQTQEERKNNHAKRKKSWRIRNPKKNREIAKNGRLRAKEKLIFDTLHRVSLKYFDDKEYREIQDAINLKRRVYYFKNKEEILRKRRPVRREYYKKNKIKISKSHKAWRRKKKLKIPGENPR